MAQPPRRLRPFTPEGGCAPNGASVVRWTLTDHQGSVYRTVTAAGQVDGDGLGDDDTAVAYDAFGQAPAGLPAGWTYGFAGRERDAETGLYYNRARYYDAALARFLSEDPSGLAAGDTNLYRYVENNPLAFTDPSGLAMITCESHSRNTTSSLSGAIGLYPVSFDNTSRGLEPIFSSGVTTNFGLQSSTSLYGGGTANGFPLYLPSMQQSSPWSSIGSIDSAAFATELNLGAYADWSNLIEPM